MQLLVPDTARPVLASRRRPAILAIQEVLDRRQSMLKQLLDWNRRRRQWQRDRDTAWADQVVPGPSGLSPFQEKCEAAVVALLEERGLALRDRIVGALRPLPREGSPDPFVHARVADTAWELWIHLDQADLSGPGGPSVSLERWGALTPDDLIRDFLEQIERALDERE